MKPINVPCHIEAIRECSSDISKGHPIRNHRLFFELSTVPSVLCHIARTLPGIYKKYLKKNKRYFDRHFSYSLFVCFFLPFFNFCFLDSCFHYKTVAKSS